MTSASDPDACPPAPECLPDHQTQVIARIRQATPASTVVGIGAIAAGLWPVVPQPVLIGWIHVGLLVCALCWWGGRGGRVRAAANAGGRNRRILYLSLAMGGFWGVSACVLFPAGSPGHQALLAMVFALVIAVWLPVFTLAPATLLSFGAPAGLSLAALLLSVPTALSMAAGAMLLVLLAVLALIARSWRRVLLAEQGARQVLHHRATHDALVDLPNHGEFHRRLRDLECRHGFAIVLIDLDHFKQVNDSAGHAVGDELLRAVAAVLRRSVRESDTAARLGGDEFAVLMVNCGAPEAARVAAAIHFGVRRLCMSGDGPQRRVTASIGIACGAAGHASAAAVLSAADDACYRAKRAGRNRTEVATDAGGCERRAPAEIAGLGETLQQRRMAFWPRAYDAAFFEFPASANDPEFTTERTS